MRNNEERKKLIYVRIAELRKERHVAKKKRIMFCLGGGSLALSMCLLLSLCKTVPEAVNLLEGKTLPTLHGTASLFGNGEAFGYVLVAVLAFLLGASVTLLLYAVHKKLESVQNIENAENERKTE